MGSEGKERIHKKKSKKDKLDKKSSKSSKHKHKQKRRQQDSSTDTSDDDDATIRQSSLQRQGLAVDGLRKLLSEYPAVKKDVRELLYNIDHGQAVDVTGVPDAQLREQLSTLFLNLGLKADAKGRYYRPASCDPVLAVLGMVFLENIAPAAPKPAAATASAAATAAAQAADRPSASLPARDDSHPGNSHPAGPSATAGWDTRGGDVGDEGATAAAAQGAVPNTAATPTARRLDAAAGPNKPSTVHDAGERHPARDSHATASERPPADVLLPSPSSPADAGESRDRAEDEAVAAAEPSGRPPLVRRVVGPAAPPAELLAAAQAEAERMAAEGLLNGDGDGVAADVDDDDVIGPPPPELAAEMDAVPENEREAEVVRIIRALRAVPAPSEPDGYAILGLEETAPAAAVKKRYWQLSLLIHPDKCHHRDANEAFQAVSKASKMLQDAGARAAHDAALEDARLRKRAVEEAEQQERERQWRVLRGEEAPGPPIRPAGQPGVREEWMTAVPAQRKQAATMSQTSQNAFARNGIKDRGDTTGWTDTPQQAQQRLLLAQAGGPLALTGTGAYASMSDLRRASATTATTAAAGGNAPAGGDGGAVAAVIDSYNAQHRGKSLLEKHLEKQQQQQKKQAKAKKGVKRPATEPAPAAADAEEDWVGKHPWRPFDREKDMGPTLTAKNPKDLLKNTASLASKFGGSSGDAGGGGGRKPTAGGGERSFL